MLTLLIAQIELDKPPVGEVAGWMLWVMAGAVIVLGLAIVGLYRTSLVQQDRMIADKETAKKEALEILKEEQKKNDEARDREIELMKQIADLRQKLGPSKNE